VLVTTEMLATPRYMILATSRYERLKRFYFELKAIGVLEGLTPPSPDAAPFAGPPVRLVNRGLGQYMLRVIENILRRLGHPLTGLVLLSMAKANAEHLDAPAKRVEGPIPDSVRRPVPVLALARRLGLPPETVRRHVRSLEAGGYCRRVPGGRLAALEKLDSDEGGPGLPANLANVMRLMDHLSAFGALAYWEAEASRTA
jgi:DNA-binding transcriptional ArsR family regulator